MSTDETNKQLWTDAQKRFQALLVSGMNPRQDDIREARKGAILEIAAMIETVRNDPVRLADPDNHMSDLIDMLLEQVVSLLATEGD